MRIRRAAGVGGVTDLARLGQPQQTPGPYDAGDLEARALRVRLSDHLCHDRFKGVATAAASRVWTAVASISRVLMAALLRRLTCVTHPAARGLVAPPCAPHGPEPWPAGARDRVGPTSTTRTDRRSAQGKNLRRRLVKQLPVVGDDGRSSPPGLPH